MKRFLACATFAYVLAFVALAYAGEGEFYGPVTNPGLGGFIGHGIRPSFDPTNISYYGNYSLFNDRPSALDFVIHAPNSMVPPALPSEPPPIYIDAAYGSYCREYSQTVRRGDQMQESYGVACLQTDGSWKAMH